MAARSGGSLWLLLAVAAAVSFFFVVAQITGWATLQLRRFSIPVDGGPHLTTADEWRSELDTLSADISSFWSDQLAAEGQVFQPPVFIAPWEGPRRACGGAVATRATAYCIATNTLELRRISFNGTSRAGAGRGHMAVAYTVARLTARAVQKSLGVDLTGQIARGVIEDQAECLAGVWLRSAPARYGTVRKSDLSAILRAARVSAPEPWIAQPEVLVEDFAPGRSGPRLVALTRGFDAADFSECLS
ncbi:MAG: neutral zinc metallopeptidase [Pseudomonadota bacterium]